MSRRRKTRILKLNNNIGKEMSFELQFQRTLSMSSRFKMMFTVSNRIKEMLIKHGHRKPVEIIKRKQS
jgi:hypothetical protein